MSNQFVAYDIECFPNFFSAVFIDIYTKEQSYFEVSWRVNHLGALLNQLSKYQAKQTYMIGFNNVGYDYPVIHELMTGFGYHDAASIYKVNERIINTPYEDRFTVRIPPYQVLIPQIDLLMIHHFDNKAKLTSLKKIEFVNRSHAIEESKHPFGVPLPETDVAADETMYYNIWDVQQTMTFAIQSWKEIQFRFDMTHKYGRDFINHNDTKIGKDYFIMELEKAGVQCYSNGQKRQTFRQSIALKDCLFNYIQFEAPELKQLHRRLYDQVIYETKGSLKISVEHKGFKFDFGLGGIHGSVIGQKFEEDDEYMIKDADVTSYYPSLAIKNRVYPEHLSEVFCDVYQDVFNQRKSFAKGTAENAAMKLALNGVYGDSNNVYSPFYDPKYTMTITVNGQLLLVMLAEQLMKIPGMTMIQINTDGMTIKMPRKYEPYYNQICDWWQKLTLLTLEYVNYKTMLVRDVNNYIAVPVDGSPKFKGAYVHTGAHEDVKGDKLGWHKNHSALIVKKAVAECVLNGTPIDYFIRNHTNIYDFFSLTTVNRTDRLQLHQNGEAVKELQRNSRYLICNDGYQLIKLMPPVKRRTKNVKLVWPNWESKKVNGVLKHYQASNLAEYENGLALGYIVADGGTYEKTPVRVFELEKDFVVQIFNEVKTDDVKAYDINYEYYIEKATKLVNAMLGIDYESE